MENIKTFKCLDDFGIKNAFIGKPYDFSINNPNNLKDVAKFLDVDIDKVYEANQTHSCNIEMVTNEDKVGSDKFKNVDGLITNVKGVTLLIKVADCQAIFIYDPVKKVIGNVHSGWKGTSDKIIIKALDKIIMEYQSKKEDLIICINPCILGCHFEIEDDVLTQFKEKIGPSIEEFLTIGKIISGKQKYYLDLVKLNEKILIDYGIKKENIYLSNTCTVCDEDKFYSYRAEKTPKRNGAVISLS